jgi:DNA invertase Pin-like site-specific DNA recombinase
VADFAIYTRASEMGSDGSLSSDPADQEAAARAWAERQPDVVIVDVVDEVASGGLGADERRLGELIRRCEAGELAGIIVRDERRFARDLLGGWQALQRMVVVGARLVATATGFDSANLNSNSEMLFNIMLSVAQAERQRNLEARMHGKARFAERGGYAATPPFGYDRIEGRLVRNGDAEVVRRIFALRAQGMGFSEIGRETGVERSHAFRIVKNRAYVGEQRVPDPDRRGELRVYQGSHEPIVTPAEWEAANAVKGRAPIRTGLSASARLKGLVRCGVCGQTLSVQGAGGNRRKPTYACTRRGCGKVAMMMAKVEPAVFAAVHQAVEVDEPHVAAVLAGDDRYQRALEAVEQAQQSLAEYRDNVELQQILGIRDFTVGLRARRDAVEVARRALRETPRPDNAVDRMREFDANDLAGEYEQYETSLAHRVVAEVRVYPKTSQHRLTLRWQGAEAELPVALRMRGGHEVAAA